MIARKMVAVLMTMLVLATSLVVSVRAAESTNEVYDFGVGEDYPKLWVPAPMTVDTFSALTGIELADEDWLNVSYTAADGNETSAYYYIATAESDDMVNVTWNASVWLDVMASVLNGTYDGVRLSVNNDSEETFLPVPPVETGATFFDDTPVTVMAIGDNEVDVGGGVTVQYNDAYENDDINFTENPAIVVTYEDDDPYPLESYGWYYNDAEELFIETTVVDDEATDLHYIVVVNVKFWEPIAPVEKTVRYWGLDDATSTQKYVTGKEVTYSEAAGTDYTVYTVPSGSVVKVAVKTGLLDDYKVTLNGDGTYAIARKWYARFNAEDAADVAASDSGVIRLNGVYMTKVIGYVFNVDDTDGVTFTSSTHFAITNSYDYGVKTWGLYDKKTTIEVEGFTWW